MKKSLLILLLTSILLVVGCGSGEQAQGNTPKEGFVFDYNGVEIPLHADVEPILEDLGEPMDYFEAESCAFQGLDKIYYYGGFQLTTYPKDSNTDCVSIIDFNDDSVSTKEGIHIGSSEADLLEAYADDYAGGQGSYTYTQDEDSIMFIVEDGSVASITYQAVVEGA
ncbi:MAG: hypothetical protein GX815_06725 [Clostridiales bacterium]|nr:hypothetical protein [Clostridiales bacterium]